jgi:hypothetical protein
MKTMRNDILNWPFAVCLGLLVAAPLYCLLLNPYPEILLRDQWRMAPLALDYYAGTFRVADLFAPHYNVSILFYKTLFLLNAVFLKLNMPVEFMVGMFFVFIYSCVVLFAIRRDIDDRRMLPLLLLPVLFTIYSQTQNTLWHFSLLAVLFGLLLLLAAATVFFLDKFLAEDGRPRHALFSLLCLGALVVGETTSSFIALFALLALLGLQWLLRPGLRGKLLRYACGALLLCLLAGGLQILYTRILWPNPTQYDFIELLSNPGERVLYTLELFGASLCIPGTRNYGLPVLGAAIILLYAAAIRASLRSKTGSSLPVFLILCSFAFALVLLIGRSGTGVGPATAPRYVHGMRIGLTGLAWIAGVHILRLRSNLLRKGALAAFLCIWLVLEGASVAKAVRYNASYAASMAEQREILEARRYEDLARGIYNPKLGVEYIRRVDADLRRLGLAMYRNDPPPSAPDRGETPGQ